MELSASKDKQRGKISLNNLIYILHFKVTEEKGLNVLNALVPKTLGYDIT